MFAKYVALLLPLFAIFCPTVWAADHAEAIAEITSVAQKLLNHASHSTSAFREHWLTGEDLPVTRWKGKLEELATNYCAQLANLNASLPEDGAALAEFFASEVEARFEVFLHLEGCSMRRHNDLAGNLGDGNEFPVTLTHGQILALAYAFSKTIVPQLGLTVNTDAIRRLVEELSGDDDPLIAAQLAAAVAPPEDPCLWWANIFTHIRSFSERDGVVPTPESID
ncbi:hypothetical protein EBZ39_12685 [bacterium]|nr:hypothetical protein [bacterium]